MEEPKENQPLAVHLPSHTRTMDSIRTLATSVSHDFNNVLTSVIGFAGMIENDLASIPGMEANRSNTAEILAAASRGVEYCRSLANLGRLDGGFSMSCSFEDFLKTTDESLRPELPENIDLQWDLNPDSSEIQFDGLMILDLLKRIVDNSVAAMPDGGTIKISTRQRMIETEDLASFTHLQAGPHVMLTVTDDGPGSDLSPTKLFQPFVPFEHSNKLAGLGLALVAEIVGRHKGDLAIQSDPSGTTVTILLPSEIKTEEPQKTHVQTHRTSKHILVVDRDPMIRRLAQRILSAFGYEVSAAASGVDIASISQLHPGFDLLLVDHVLPSLEGKDFISSLANQFPDIAILYMTDEDPIQPGYLSKPFRQKELLGRIEEAIGPTPDQL